MRRKIVFSALVAAISLGAFVICRHWLGYTGLLILFLITVLFGYNSVKLYGKVHPESGKRAVYEYLWIAFAFYFYFLFLMTFSVKRSSPRFIFESKERLRYYLRFRCNFVPFNTIRGMLKLKFSFRFILVNLFGNLVALAPLGFFLPRLIRPARKFFPFLIISTLVVVFIESVQFLFGVGACDIDDLILNVTGAVIVFWILKIPVFKKFVEM